MTKAGFLKNQPSQAYFVPIYKAKTSANMGDTANPAGSAAEQEAVPVPKLFLDVIQRQWAHPSSVPPPQVITIRSFIVLAQNWKLYYRFLQWIHQLQP